VFTNKSTTGSQKLVLPGVPDRMGPTHRSVWTADFCLGFSDPV
jgi:hypothetical protein